MNMPMRLPFPLFRAHEVESRRRRIRKLQEEIHHIQSHCLHEFRPFEDVMRRQYVPLDDSLAKSRAGYSTPRAGEICILHFRCKACGLEEHRPIVAYCPDCGKPMFKAGGGTPARVVDAPYAPECAEPPALYVCSNFSACKTRIILVESQLTDEEELEE